MVHSIDPALVVGSSVTPASSGVLQSQLTRYETQLADSCACSSSKTQAGKQKIADLQTKADAIRAELQQVEAARSQEATTATATTPQSAQSQVAPSRFLDVVV
ncbi:MAG: hypothetical protein ABI640_18020 [Gammaproteobacteria bacterium]